MTHDLNPQHAIAIIGMAGQFPHSPSLDIFWENLKAGKELISFFEGSELSNEIPLTTKQDLNYVKAKGIIEQIDCFDATLFNIPPREAEYMDPQQRLLLQGAWQALEHAGYDPDQYSGEIGVFVGASLSSYFFFQLFPWLYFASPSERHREETLMVLGNEKDFLATRIAYKLNLKGPSKTIQTACSTSLVAIHDACQNLLNYQCDIALAGGISVTLPHKAGYYFSKEGINSPDGHCRAFDHRAQGTVSGNGWGMIVLKRLEEAIGEGDTIHAVIRGTAINNDGAGKMGFTAPSIEGQARVIAAAQAVADIHPRDISYIEAHGTGTILGDPIEIAALKLAFALQTQDRHFCGLGSVKTNIGHLDAAAGIAGLLKVVLSLKNRLIPPSLHFEKPNVNIDFDNSPFFVHQNLNHWQNALKPRCAGVSSFGIGGTNAHAVLQEAPDRDCLIKDDVGEYQILPFSAATAKALQAISLQFIDYLKSTKDCLENIAFTLQVGRKALEFRTFFICKNKQEAIAQMQEKSSFHFDNHFLNQMGVRWKNGEKIDWSQLHLGKRRVRIPLPTYPFEKTPYWFNPQISPQSFTVQSNLTLYSLDRPASVERAESGLEKLITSFWERAFKRAPIGVTDNFFNLGGDSLLMIEIAQYVNECLYIEIPIKLFFENPTIRELSLIAQDMLLEILPALTEIQADKITNLLQQPIS